MRRLEQARVAKIRNVKAGVESSEIAEGRPRGVPMPRGAAHAPAEQQLE